MSNEISNSDDVIDSRDIIERIDELQTEIDGEYEAYCESKKEIDETPFTRNRWLEIEHNENSPIAQSDDELKALVALQGECEGYSDWKHGEALIRGTYWVEYCEQLCKDIGDLPDKIPHYIEIDWEKTAENISADYSCVDFDGVEYYIRNC